MRTWILAVIMVLFAATSFAADEGYLYGRTATKWKRGFVNVVTAPGEIPVKVVEEVRAGGSGPIKKTAAVLGGTVKGLVWTIGRVGSGLWDMLTLNVDVPGNNEPLMKPVFIWRKE